MIPADWTKGMSMIEVLTVLMASHASKRELRRLAALEMVAPMSERRARMSVLVVEIRRMLDESDPDGRDGALVRRQEMDPLSAAVLLEHEVKRVGR